MTTRVLAVVWMAKYGRQCGCADNHVNKLQAEMPTVVWVKVLARMQAMVSAVRAGTQGGHLRVVTISPHSNQCGTGVGSPSAAVNICGGPCAYSKCAACMRCGLALVDKKVKEEQRSLAFLRKKKAQQTDQHQWGPHGRDRTPHGSNVRLWLCGLVSAGCKPRHIKFSFLGASPKGKF